MYTTVSHPFFCGWAVLEIVNSAALNIPESMPLGEPFHFSVGSISRTGVVEL